MDRHVYWMLVDHQGWNLYIAATDDGLCYVGPHMAPFEELDAWVKKHLPHFELVENPKRMKSFEEGLKHYFDGKETAFSMPTNLHGTVFQQSVWTALQAIPYGQTVTYSDIAESIGKPTAVRAVGTAIGANPLLMVVPCHRVIGKNGKLTGFRGGLEMKERLLCLEKEANERA